MKRVLVYCPDQDPTSFYRGARPWQLISKALGDDYRITFISSTSGRPLSAAWDQAGFFDLVFLQRPYHPELLSATINFKRMGAKIWVDEDDLQTDVPWSFNSAYTYNTEQIQNTIRGILGLADVVTVSVDFLGEKLKEFAHCPVYTVPNAFDLETFPKPILPPKEKVILWRGSAACHQADLISVRHEIYQVLKENPDWKMYFLGLYPWWYDELKDEFPDGMPKNAFFVRHTPTMFDYMEAIKHLNPAIWIVPLVDNNFTRSKSNLAWLEASWVGASVMAEHMDEFIKPGIIPRGKDWKTGLTDMIEFVENENSSLLSWNYIEENLLLSKVNEKRIEILKGLIG